MPREKKPIVEKPKKPACKLCKKTLRRMGNMRVNGANREDWSGRQYHVECYKIVKGIERLNRDTKEYEEEFKNM